MNDTRGIVLVGSLMALVVGILLLLIGIPRILLSGVIQRVEGISPRNALQRAKEMMAMGQRVGRPSSYIGNTLIVGGIVLLILQGTIGAVLSELDLQRAALELFRATPILRLVFEQVVSLIPYSLIFGVALPYIAVSVALTYFERRVNLEALDIDVLAQLARRRQRNA